MRILITGAAGFIGSHLTDRLLAEGHSVLGIDNLRTGVAANFKSGQSSVLHIGEIGSRNFWRSCGGFDVVVHAAASYKDPNDHCSDIETNVYGTSRVVEFAAKESARLIYFQTALCYGNQPSENSVTLDHPLRPESSYAISKTAGEAYILNSGLDFVSFRLANIYGPRNLSGPIPTFYKRLAAGEPCTVADTRRDFVYIDDLVELVMKAVDGGPSGVYHAATGKDFPISQLWSEVNNELGTLAAYPEITPRGKDDAPTIRLDPSQTMVAYNWKPTTPLSEGIPKAVRWYREFGVTDTYTHLAMRG